MAGVDPYLDCRRGNLGHAWYWVPVPVGYDSTFKAPRGWHRIWSRCERCTTVRKTVVDSQGMVQERDYEHPTDWKKYERGTMPSAADFRLMAIKRKG